MSPLKSCDNSYYFSGPEHSERDHWIGRGAQQLQLTGPVDQDHLDGFFAGRDVRGSNLLTQARLGKHRTNLGYDCVFSAPKSVSLVALAGPTELAREAHRAHRTAVTRALEFFDSQISQVRRQGSTKTTYIDSIGIVGAGFEHAVTRSLDPHLHSHVVFANLTRGSDGLWSSFNSAFIWASARTTGYLYQANLRHELTKTLGVGWAPVKNGVSDISGIPRGVIESFSTRSQQIQARLHERSADISTANRYSMKRFAALSSRDDKPVDFDLRGLSTLWQERLETLGVELNGDSNLFHRSQVPEVSNRLDVELTSAIVSSRAMARSPFGLYRHTVNTACELIKPGSDPGQIVQIAREVVESPIIRRERKNLGLSNYLAASNGSLEKSRSTLNRSRDLVYSRTNLKDPFLGAVKSRDLIPSRSL